MNTPSRRAALILLAAAASMLVTPAGKAQGSPSAPVFDVRNYGAKGDGVTLNTAALNKTIEACAKAGGGTVYVPAGKYLSGTIHLKSNVTLWLDSGATILGSPNMADYDEAVPGYVAARPGKWYSSLVQAQDVEHVAIVGHGVIDGRKVFNPDGEEHMRGPHGLYFLNCRDFTVRDVTIRDSGNYNTIFIGCARGNIEGISVFGGWDGIHFRYTRDVTISNCRLFTGDDSLAGEMWQNVTIDNCILNSSCQPLRIGGQNILINNTLIYGPGQNEHRTTGRHDTLSAVLHWGARALGPGQTRPEGYNPLPTDNIVFNAVTMRNIRTPFNMDSGRVGLGAGLGIRNITLNNLTVVDAGKYPFSLVGDPDNPIESLALNNVRITAEGGIAANQADGYSINESAGFVFRNIKRVELSNVRLDFKDRDARARLIASNVEKLELDRFLVSDDPGGFAPFALEKVGRVVVNGQPAHAVTPQIRALALDLSRTAGKAIVGEPFNAIVTVGNPGAEGFGEVRIQFGKQTLSKTVWLKGTSRVLFAGLKCDAPGGYTVQAGAFRKSLSAEAAPAKQPVGAPYSTFSNVKADMSRLGGGFYIESAGEFLLERADQYGSIYLKQGLPDNSVVTVKLDKVDRSGPAYGNRAGIMVRNDITSPGKSPGYVVLAASLFESNGWDMEWDANGDGRIDQHTEFAGYTLWPHWLKLERRGNRYTGYYSLNGSDWKRITEVEAPGASTAQDVGMFVSYGSARFQDIKIAALEAPIAKR